MLTSGTDSILPGVGSSDLIFAGLRHDAPATTRLGTCVDASTLRIAVKDRRTNLTMLGMLTMLAEMASAFASS